METAPLWVGVDVAKDQLDVAIGPAGETWSVPNDHEGIRSLVTNLRGRTCGLIVLEATGGFEIP
ncbi:MAG TPA: IS110 family transposase, partial [Vicinamibacterales bacterium]|nr:IS110 family transposase [Vicinamibacterales bacterium]